MKISVEFVHVYCDNVRLDCILGRKTLVYYRPNCSLLLLLGRLLKIQVYKLNIDFLAHDEAENFAERLSASDVVLSFTVD